MSLAIRAATPEDAPLILALLRELADYSNLLPAFRTGEADIRRLLFGPVPRAFCEIAEADGEALGLTVWFYTVNTFEGEAGLYLEDLYVRPGARGGGVGRALMAALARRCRDEGLGGIEWSVMVGNDPAFAFYARLGAAAKSDWVGQRLSGGALRALGEG